MSRKKSGDDIGFKWWFVWSCLCLVVGTLGLVWMQSGILGGWAILLACLNALVSVFMLQHSRAAFLTMTILSFNPLLWVINGIYLKNRWNHPLVLAGSGRDKSTDPTRPEAAPASTVPVAALVEPILTQSNNNNDYQSASEEIESGNIDKGLWARLFSEADGDENRTRARYIKERVATMRSC